MTTRAAINILGSTGEVIDITSLGVSNLTTQHPGPGQYLVLGTLGMVPPPLGWGHVVNQLDADCSVSISFNEGILAVSVARDGEPSDLLHSITLHVAVEELPPMVAPEPDKAELAQGSCPAGDLMPTTQLRRCRTPSMWTRPRNRRWPP
ncbi:phage tail protein [Pseudomonas poae]